MNPCIDYCYFRFGRRYSPGCDTSCEFAKTAKESIELRAEVARLAAERDKAVSCINEVRAALENGDAGLALAETNWYNEMLRGKAE